MVENVSPTALAGGLAQAAAAQPADARPAAEGPAAQIPLPEDPPHEVLAALAAAQRAIRELDRARIRLRFEVEQTEAGRRVRVDVLDGEGRVLRTIPPSELGPLLLGGAGSARLLDVWG
jgi:hypothetical protein